MPETISENMIEKNKTLTEEEKTEKVKLLRKLLEDEETLKGLRTDDEYLERFLYGTNFDIELSFEKMKTFYELLLEYPEWYSKTAPIERKELIDKNIRVIIPQQDKEGRPIYITKLGNVDVTKMHILHVVSVDDIWIEYVLQENTEYAGKGLCVIVDIQNYSWRMMKWITPDNIKNSVRKLQTFPFKDYRFHIVNQSHLIQATMKILMPFLPQYIKDMMKFHFNDRDSLYKYIDREVLPPEYGGYTDVDYQDIFEQLYRKNDSILESFEMHRTLTRPCT